MAVRLASCVLLSMPLGCAPLPQGAERGQGRVDRNGYYVVKAGDTLGGIALRYGFDYRELAGINGLRRPYLLRPGDRLAVKGRAVRRERALNSQPGRSVAAGASPRPAATRTAQPAASTASKPAPRAPAPRSGTAVASAAVNGEAWRWPAAGAVVKAYADSGNVHKGIDIAGKVNQPVVAAKSGKVVYAGAGLKAYGLLVIIKHDAYFLSAYAYNEKAFVKEGDLVRQGQKIALMGTKEGGQARLHFEIRKDGKPLNPITLLPGR
jgi:lipoprotein NlpD